jgi:hypothetical protein
LLGWEGAKQAQTRANIFFRQYIFLKGFDMSLKAESNMAQVLSMGLFKGQLYYIQN